MLARDGDTSFPEWGRGEFLLLLRRHNCGKNKNENFGKKKFRKLQKIEKTEKR
jgi:hypothetical protein